MTDLDLKTIYDDAVKVHSHNQSEQAWGLDVHLTGLQAVAAAVRADAATKSAEQIAQEIIPLRAQVAETKIAKALITHRRYVEELHAPGAARQMVRDLTTDLTPTELKRRAT